MLGWVEPSHGDTMRLTKLSVGMGSNKSWCWDKSHQVMRLGWVRPSHGVGIRATKSWGWDGFDQVMVFSWVQPSHGDTMRLTKLSICMGSTMPWG